MRSFTFFLLSLSLLLAGCAPAPTATESPSTAATASPSRVEASDTPAPSATANPNVTSTPDLRLPPEKWQEWPVVPHISAPAREIYQRGLALGNDPHAFSKIGDCQSVPASFLGIYDTDRYSFAPEYQYLQETVDAFAGSFNREGESVRGGFNASSVLLPIWAMSSEACQPGENPMECENRIHNPSIVFISLEVWFEGRTPDVYENYLRQIIEYNLKQGTLPILATKADNVEGDYSINYTIAKLAFEYDLPLWNFWLAVQSLPNHGLDPTENPGFHLLKPDGWNKRSFTALQVLDAIHRATTDLTADGTPLATSSASTAAPLLSFTPGPVAGLPFSRVDSASADSANTSILLGFSTRAGAELTSAGIFQGNLNGRDWLALAESGFTLLDYSDAGILATQENNLYLIKDSRPTLLTDQLISETGQPAVLIPDGRVAALLQTEAGNQITILSEGAPQFLPAAVNTPQILYPSRDPNRIYWGAGKCDELGCPVDEIIATTLSNFGSTVIPFAGQPAFAADGKTAFMVRDANGQNQLTLVNGDQTQIIPLFGNRLVHMEWSPDASTLAVSVANVRDYSGLVLKSRLYFVSWPASVDLVLDLADETIEQHIWSSDGKSILVVTRQITDAQYQFNFFVLDAVQQAKIPALGFQLVSEKYLILNPIYWLP